jgi:signal transduction histidine kinase
MLILFSHRISSHYKYFETYKKLQQLSISLDKRVDEKTIQYNELIVKQKEYIGFISHEVRTPITNAIFLSDSLKEDLQQISISHTILEDSNLLNKELIKVSDIIKHVFSSEQFDVNKVKMYKKYIDVAGLLLEEISLFQARFPDVLFQLDIASTAKQKIDEIQFRQVIQNLITNAIKFSS